jgi:hypothetical protein
MIHNSKLKDSGVSETKSQKLSCTACERGKPRSGYCLAAGIRSGNFIASGMKKTGMLLPVTVTPVTRRGRRANAGFHEAFLAGVFIRPCPPEALRHSAEAKAPA